MYWQRGKIWLKRRDIGKKERNWQKRQEYLQKDGQRRKISIKRRDIVSKEISAVWERGEILAKRRDLVKKERYRRKGKISADKEVYLQNRRNTLAKNRDNGKKERYREKGEISAACHVTCSSSKIRCLYNQVPEESQITLLLRALRQ